MDEPPASSGTVAASGSSESPPFAVDRAYRNAGASISIGIGFLLILGAFVAFVALGPSMSVETLGLLLLMGMLGVLLVLLGAISIWIVEFVPSRVAEEVRRERVAGEVRREPKFRILPPPSEDPRSPGPPR